MIDAICQLNRYEGSYSPLRDQSLFSEMGVGRKNYIR